MDSGNRTFQWNVQSAWLGALILALLPVIHTHAQAPAPMRFVTTTGSLGFSNGAFRLQVVDIRRPPIRFVIEASTNVVNWTGIYTNVAPATSIGFLDVDASNHLQRSYRAIVSPLFSFGLAASEKIDLNGKNLTVDSFDSSDPIASVGGRYDPAKARDHGDVAAYRGITNSVDIGSATIRGNVATGPGGSAQIGPAGSISGTISDDMNLDFPRVTLPIVGGFTAADRFNTNINGTVYNSVFDGGNYRLLSWTINPAAKTLIAGDVFIYVPNGFSMSGTSQIQVAPGAKLTIYTGANISIGGNGILNPADATKCMIYGFPTCTSINMGGNAGFTGTIYAPSANLAVAGGGATAYDFQGASVTKTVTLNGAFNFHYDEKLRRLD